MDVRQKQEEEGTVMMIEHVVQGGSNRIESTQFEPTCTAFASLKDGGR